MRYDELVWDGRHPDATAHSQALVPTGRACPMLNDWPAYRVVRHLDPAAAAAPDMYLLRCYRTQNVACLYPYATAARLYYPFTADLLTLACLLVHLEPAPLLSHERAITNEQAA
jgi:hypothetical protein